MNVIIGPKRIADNTGTHEPGDVVRHASPALVALAQSGACDPESGMPWCELEDVVLQRTVTPAPVAVPKASRAQAAASTESSVAVSASDATPTKENA
jgi:hypothetical protein